MKQYYLIIAVLQVFTTVVSAQVGIGTTNPSSASMLEISSTPDGGTTFKGFMPPRVENQSQRNQINASSTDIGLIVFVVDTGTLEIWNGISWEQVYSLTTTITTVVAQDFDSNLSWSYTLNPSSYNVNDDIWEINNNVGSGNTSAIDFVSGNFLACRDLNNPNGGGNFPHEISFVNVNVSSLVNPRIAFDYDVFGFDNADDVYYEVFHDDISQGVVPFINGNANLTVQGTEIIPIPSSVNNVRITLSIEQNGAEDFAGFDNFRVYGE